ncbi:MAG: hypothetical protein UT67_C0006G0003 [Candidatus Magasanikbacteria bacterium GW2011_GWA2_40_10]|uniref:Uncharacterized protein n=1 Tax=Candidatus Magasanikbacteria bacterium GW2011_GWA2_40_10 TaxID=1619037 RepID=A0A0G0Q367_9BACT|nr:MAG: hypothetical protein UT67_C0006G0003 [Candidatus Magasanikbacteria bacterium GW2011_GWA2_40_10]
MAFANFGEVYSFEDKKLVFLANTKDIIYFAVISGWDDNERVGALKRLRDRQATSNPEKLKDSIFCFVELTTKEFCGCIAHPAVSDSEKDFDLSCFAKNIGKLNEGDEKDLKAIITDPETKINRTLKKLVSEL